MGTLYVCATPIGNLEDASIRLLKTLRKVHLIACEDTRRTGRLLERYHIKNRLISYHRHNLREREDYLIRCLQAGQDVALVSDAGMPAISDPGQELVARAIREGLQIVVIPGPSALISALALSGIDTTRFVFEGFLPSRAGQRRESLARLAGETRTIVLYEAPHRLLQTLQDIQETLGERKIAVARELTKKYEEVVRGTVEEVKRHFSLQPPRGEFTLILEGRQRAVPQVDAATLMREVEELIAGGIEKKQAFKIKAREYGLKKNDVYKLFFEKPGF